MPEENNVLEERLASIERRNKIFDTRIMVVTSIIVVVALVLLFNNIIRRIGP